MENKLKVMYEKPDVSDAELEKFMDFDQLLVNRAALIRKRKIQYAVGGISCVVMVAAIFWWINSFREEVSTLQRQTSINETVKSPVEAVIVVDSADNNMPTIEKAEEKLITPSTKKTIVTQPEVTIKDEKEPVYIQSAPVEGYANLYTYFERELIYPEEAIADSIQGTVTAHCTIGKDGKPKNIRIENSLGKAFDVEVIRIIESMPNWNPATLNGIPMESKISLPLSFKLKSSNHE